MGNTVNIRRNDGTLKKKKETQNSDSFIKCSRFTLVSDFIPYYFQLLPPPPAGAAQCGVPMWLLPCLCLAQAS